MMKLFLTVIVTLACFGAHAQSVSLHNFNTNQFSTNAHSLPLPAGQWLVNVNTQKVVTFPSLNTNWFQTNGYVVQLNTNLGSAYSNSVVNILNSNVSVSPQVWTNDNNSGTFRIVGLSNSIGFYTTVPSTFYDPPALELVGGYPNTNSVMNLRGDIGIINNGQSVVNWGVDYTQPWVELNVIDPFVDVTVLDGMQNFSDKPYYFNTGTNNVASGSIHTAFANHSTNKFNIMGNGDLYWGADATIGWSPPSTNGLPNQALVTDGGTPQQLSWNTFISGITGGTTNFATTNSNAGLTNAVTNIIAITLTNRIPNFIHGSTNQIAKFSPNTNEVGDSIVNELATNMWVWMSRPIGTAWTNQITNSLYGQWSSANNWERLDFVSANGHGNAYNEIHGVNGASETEGVWPLKLMDTLIIEAATPITGHGAYAMYPAVTDVMLFGKSGNAVKSATFGTGNIDFGVTASPPTLRGSLWGISFPGTSLDFYRNVASSATLSTRFGTVGSSASLGWDFAGNVLGFGNGIGSCIAFIKVSESEDLGIVQLGTNNAGATTPQKVGLTGAIGTGSNHGGSSVELKVGSGTGTARNGDFSISTAPSTASSGSTANSSYVTNFYIASQPVTLTESTATLFANVTVPSGKVVGFTVDVTVEANDSTDFQSDHQVFAVSCVNKSGTVTTAISASVPSANAVSAGTLTSTFTAVANGNSCDLKCNAVSSLTQTTLRILGGTIIHLQGSGQPVITSQ